VLGSQGPANSQLVVEMLHPEQHQIEQDQTANGVTFTMVPFDDGQTYGTDVWTISISADVPLDQRINGEVWGVHDSQPAIIGPGGTAIPGPLQKDILATWYLIISDDGVISDNEKVFEFEDVQANPGAGVI